MIYSLILSFLSVYIYTLPKNLHDDKLTYFIFSLCVYLYLTGGVADRVLSQLLTELDGIRPLKQVVVLAATNRPDLVDGALTRPGRIDRMLYVSLPDALARHEILNIHTRKVPLDVDVDLKKISCLAMGLSGAEIAGLCREASMHAMERNAMEVKQIDFVNAMNDIEPRTTVGMLEFYESFGK